MENRTALSDSKPYKDPEFSPEDLGQEPQDLFSDLPAQQQFTNVPANYEEAEEPVHREIEQVNELGHNGRSIEQQFDQQMNRDWGLWDRIAEPSMYRQVQKIKRELLETTAQYRLNFYKTMLDARLEALSEKMDAGLKCIKGHYRQQVSSFLMSKMEDLTVEVKGRQIRFIELMKEKYQYSETLRNYPTMHKRYMNAIFEEEGRYLQFLDSLIIRFQGIVDEQLRKY